jgi:diacylglycerol kinase (ATP)
LNKRIAVIVNPASGQDRPVLSILNRVFHPAGVDWDVFVTKRAGDARRYAEAAVEAGYDAVGVYGGDGTVAQAASGLIGKPTPLAIFPGGTANVMSFELGIPGDLPEAVALVFDETAKIRQVDVGRVAGRDGQERYFVLRVGIGFEAEMVGGADRGLKDRLGDLAYALSALNALREPPMARYRLTLDGREVESEGMTCIVANSGSMGRTGLSLAPGIDVSDGLLDVLVIRRSDLPALLSLAASLIRGKDTAEPLQRWQAREVAVAADPPQTVTVDGEIVEGTPFAAEVIPRAVRVLVPAGTETRSEQQQD